jgi:hypothetical protein
VRTGGAGWVNAGSPSGDADPSAVFAFDRRVQLMVPLILRQADLCGLALFKGSGRTVESVFWYSNSR